VNRYVYAHSSPESWVDPSGEISVRGLLCTAGCVLSIVTSSNYLARSGYEGFQQVLDKVQECEEAVGDKAIEDAAFKLIADELTAADAATIAAEVAPVGEEWIVMIIIQTDDLIVIVVFEG
jgi:hypothetical protein